MPPVLPIRSIDNAIGLHQGLGRMGIPRAGRDSIVRMLKVVNNPGETGGRRALAETLLRDHPAETQDNTLQERGIAIFKPGAFPHADEAVTDCRAAFLDFRKNSGNKGRPAHYKSDFLVSVFRSEDAVRYPDVMNFVLSEPMVQFVSRYFGEVPLLTDVSLKWSPRNDTLKESQLFHRDGEDSRQLKLLLNVDEVTADHGPMVAVPAAASQLVMNKLGYKTGRVDDDAVVRIAGKESLFNCAGPAGQVAAVDTSRCLHYGSRGNSKDRLVLFIQFVRYLVPKQNTVSWPSTIAPLLAKLNPAQRRILNFT